MNEQKNVQNVSVSSNPSSRKVVHFNETISTSMQFTTSTSLLTTSSSTTSLTLPLIAGKAGVRFKITILFLGLFIALIIGFILSLLLVSQVISVPTQSLPSHRFHTTAWEHSVTKHNHRLFQYLDSFLIDQLDLNTDVCRDFHGFVCRKWLTQHPLSPLEFKRSWLTESSESIRSNFARTLTNYSENYAYNYQMELEGDQTEKVTREKDIVDFDGPTSIKNELEQFYSFHDGFDDTHHKLVKRQLSSPSNDLNQSISNMLLYYNQCIHTSESVLLQQLHQLAHDRFWFTNNYEIISTTNHLYFLFEQMIEHPLLHIWNVNTINFHTQIILHIQRQIQDQQTLFSTLQIEQASLFEHYVENNQINLCYQSPRVGPLANTLKEYQQLLTFSFPFTNSTMSDDLHRLISDQDSLPIIHSSVKRSSDLRDLIQFILDKQIIGESNHTEIYNLLRNFTTDLEQYLMTIPLFRSTITHQCQLFLSYYIHFRSFNETNYETWLDYISSSILYLIVHSWPGDASYVCLFTTIVRQNQLEMIPYWKIFLDYNKNQIKDLSSPIISAEIRLIDFFQLDSIFRFLFADQFAHYCNLMVYKYGPKLLPFVSVFHEGIQISLKSLRKQILQDNSLEQTSKTALENQDRISHLFSNEDLQSFSLSFNNIPSDCLTLLEYYYPFTLSSFYEDYMFNKTEDLYAIVYELRDLLRLSHSSNEFLSSLQFHIKPERLKLFEELSPTMPFIPYEYYPIEDNYLSTAWNIIESSREELLQPTHEFFEINGHHAMKRGIFLQPTVAEFYANESTRVAALLLIAHELGHAVCPCGGNLTNREHIADLIALNLILRYQEQQMNPMNISLDDMKTFFILYGQSECAHINREMMPVMNKQQDTVGLHLNRVLRGNEAFQAVFNCSFNQRKHAMKINSLLLDICAACRDKKNN
ncbi:unnamed protein product [Adineta ricciae]|uniref:Uncharacterized protein n=1 Tax=Adineta ricciae TaxID=249248 RepID=A0A814T9P9_ADIRI|nr:unnamed protein product [Adineta ricciae]